MKRTIALAALAALQLACSSSAEQPKGSISLRAVVSDPGTSIPIDRMTVEVPATGQTSELVPDLAGAWIGTVVAPPGMQQVIVRAYIAGALVGEGSADVEVSSGGTATAVVWVLDVTGPPPAADHGPIIRALTATQTELTPGEPAVLAVDAVDPDDDPLTYQWSQACTQGTFSSPTTSATEWWSFEEVVCTVRVTVTSGALSRSGTITFAVLGAASGPVAVQARFVPQPYVETFEVNSLEPPPPYPQYPPYVISRTLEPTRFEFFTPDASIPAVYYPGQEEYFGVTFRNLPPYPDDDPELFVGMTDDCGGTAAPTYFLGSDGGWYQFINGNGASWTWRAPPGAGLCFITVTVDYRGLRDQLTVAALLDGCADDRFHGNDSAATATPISIRLDPQQPVVQIVPLPVREWKGLWANTEDWYRFTVQPGWGHVAFVASTNDVLPLEIVMPDGISVVASGTGAVDATLVEGASYLLKVGPGAAASSCGSQYDLTALIEPAY